MKPIVNVHEVPLEDFSKGELYEEKNAGLSEKIGGKKLGYNITNVPPGKRSCPYHNHLVNEEMFFIIEGEGTYRYGGTEYQVKAGDIIAAPAGGSETAHHLLNTGKTNLKYLAVSTMESPDICEYPDSGKFLVNSDVRYGVKDRKLRYIGRKENALDYWDGEKV